MSLFVRFSLLASALALESLTLLEPSRHTAPVVAARPPLKCAHAHSSTMDARQSAPPPFQRPPDRHSNPNHQPQPQPYAGYPPPTAQPQQPLHVPFSPDPYAASRRDPFFPTSAHHARRSSQGIYNGENGPSAQAERHGGWTHTGTELFFGCCLRHSATGHLHLDRSVRTCGHAQTSHTVACWIVEHVCCLETSYKLLRLSKL